MLFDWWIDWLINWFWYNLYYLEIVIGYGSVMNKYLWLTVFSGFGLYDNAQELVIPSSVLNSIVVVPQNLMKQTKNAIIPDEEDILSHWA